MNSRLAMAQALLDRVRRLRSEIGDHGDCYEDALLTGTVSPELQVRVKEMLDHLRSALDYCAREMVERATPGAAAGNVYFPIVARGFARSDFKSRVGKLLPGVLTANPAVLPLLESFQEFANPANEWLPDLATVANENKHEQLSVSRRAIATGEIRRADGTSEMRLSADGVLKKFAGLTLMKSMPEGDGQFEAYFVHLVDIDRELLSFLNDCISGVQEVVEKISTALSATA
jgi:hypothetical protein